MNQYKSSPDAAGAKAPSDDPMKTRFHGSAGVDSPRRWQEPDAVSTQRDAGQVRAQPAPYQPVAPARPGHAGPNQTALIEPPHQVTRRAAGPGSTMLIEPPDRGGRPPVPSPWQREPQPQGPSQPLYVQRRQGPGATLPVAPDDPRNLGGGVSGYGASNPAPAPVSPRVSPGPASHPADSYRHDYHAGPASEASPPSSWSSGAQQYGAPSSARAPQSGPGTPMSRGPETAQPYSGGPPSSAQFQPVGVAVAPLSGRAHSGYAPAGGAAPGATAGPQSALPQSGPAASFSMGDGAHPAAATEVSADYRSRAEQAGNLPVPSAIGNGPVTAMPSPASRVDAPIPASLAPAAAAGGMRTMLHQGDRGPVTGLPNAPVSESLGGFRPVGAAASELKKESRGLFTMDMNASEFKERGARQATKKSTKIEPRTVVLAGSAVVAVALALGAVFVGKGGEAPAPVAVQQQSLAAQAAPKASAPPAPTPQAEAAPVESAEQAAEQTDEQAAPEPVEASPARATRAAPAKKPARGKKGEEELETTPQAEAANGYLVGDYETARAKYEALAKAHPDQPAYPAMVRLIEQKEKRAQARGK